LRFVWADAESTKVKNKRQMIVFENFI